MIWDVDLQRVLLHEGSRFELAVRFASDAPRLVLYGPSGAGKTQTLKMIAGIARPDRGRVAVAGRTLFDSTAGMCACRRSSGAWPACFRTTRCSRT